MWEGYRPLKLVTLPGEYIPEVRGMVIGIDVKQEDQYSILQTIHYRGFTDRIRVVEIVDSDHNLSSDEIIDLMQERNVSNANIMAHEIERSAYRILLKSQEVAEDA